MRKVGEKSPVKSEKRLRIRLVVHSWSGRPHPHVFCPASRANELPRAKVRRERKFRSGAKVLVAGDGDQLAERRKER